MHSVRVPWQLPQVIYSKGLLFTGWIHVILMQCDRIISSTWGSDHRCLFLLQDLVACIGESTRFWINLYVSIMSPVALLVLHTMLGSLSSHSLWGYGISWISGINLVACCCTFYKWFMSANLTGTHMVLAYSKWDQWIITLQLVQDPFLHCPSLPQLLRWYIQIPEQLPHNVVLYI